MSITVSHDERDCVSNHRRPDCLLKRLFRRRSKETSQLCVTALCQGNPPATGGFPSNRNSQSRGNLSNWWRHHEVLCELLFCLHFILAWPRPCASCSLLANIGSHVPGRSWTQLSRPRASETSPGLQLFRLGLTAMTTMSHGEMIMFGRNLAGT